MRSSTEVLQPGFDSPSNSNGAEPFPTKLLKTWQRAAPVHILMFTIHHVRQCATAGGGALELQDPEGGLDPFCKAH